MCLRLCTRTPQGMFYLADFNHDISGWNVGKVTDMMQMFHGHYFIQDVSGWDVSSVQSMSVRGHV